MTHTDDTRTAPPADPFAGLQRLVDRNVQLRAFALRLLDPEDLGHAAGREVREAAREVLNLPPAEVRR